MNEPGTWPLIGRDVEIDQLKAALQDARKSGVLVVGASGYGKTAVARHAVTTMPAGPEILYVRGSSLGPGMAYSALTVLLVDLDEQAVENPLLLLTALQAMFGRMRGTPIIVVDNVEYLDPQSATVLAHLASVRSVRLVVISERVQSTPEPFLELWRKEELARVDLEPLTLGHTRELLEGVLDGPVSRVLAVTIWRESNGSPGNLRVMIPLALDSGQVERREGVWTQRWFRMERAIEDARIAPDVLDTVAGDAREAVALLGVLGGMPLRVILHYAPAEVINRLQQDGVVRVLGGDSPTVLLEDSLAASALWAVLARAPQAALLQALDEIGRRDDVPPSSDVSLTMWLLQTGNRVPGARLLRSAKHANQLALPHLARCFLAALEAWHEIPAAVIEYARLPLSDSEADVLGSVINALLKDSTLPPAERAALRLEGVRIRMRRAPGQDGLADAMRECDVECAAVGGKDGERLTAESALLSLELKLLDGRFREVIEDSSVLLTSILDPSSAAVRAKGMLTVALASTGQYAHARVVGEAVVTCHHTSSSPRDREEAHRGTVLTLALAGRLSEALELLQAESSSRCHIQDEAWAEGMEGVILAGAGRSREALPVLLTAIAQLRVEDRSGMLPAAEAAVAYAYALDGQDDAAQEYLDGVEQQGRRHTWASRNMDDYFRMLTVSLLNDSGDAAQEMLRCADHERARGNDGLELVFLMQAVRLGEYAAAHRLSVRSAEPGSPLAESSLLFSKGVLAQHSALLLEAAEAALTIGHHDLAGSSALLAVELRADEDDPLIFVRAEQILRQTSVERRRSRTRKSLTERERAVARMVARGASNKDIAAAEHLSVRTAEGYVHRAMTKLGVHNRKQLRSVFVKP